VERMKQEEGNFLPVWLWLLYWSLFTCIYGYLAICDLHLLSFIHNICFITGHEGPEGEQRYSCTLSVTSALDWGGWLTPCPGSFTLGKSPSTHCIGGWVDPRADLDGCGKSCPHRDLISEPSSP
jgi:hypothetical protein